MSAAARRSSGTCTTYRPDADGRLVAVAAVAAPRRQPAPWPGPYGLWDNLTQSWDEGPVSLERAAALACRYVGSPVSICRYGGELLPLPLSAPERARLRTLTEDGSE